MGRKKKTAVTLHAERGVQVNHLYCADIVWILIQTNLREDITIFLRHLEIWT